MPLHVAEIMRQAKRRYGVNLTNRRNDSVVSALTEEGKLKGVAFVRTGPNVFGLKGR